jgi:hypothetical protein
MKSRSVIIFLLLMLAVCNSVNGRASVPQGDLYILVSTEQSEHSRDSNSETTTLTVSGNMLVYQQTHSGAHSRERPSVQKKFALTAEDISRLAGILHEKRLLVKRAITKSGESTGRSTHTSLSLSIRSKLNGKDGSISIEGPISSRAIRKEPLYQDSLVLLRELYRIINRTDPLLGLTEFVD